MEKLNKINNKKLIKVTSNWDFSYVEENIEIDSPVKSYYFKYNDLSINLALRFKWSLYGYFFFNSIIETLDDPIYTDDITLEGSIESNFTCNKKKIFLIDDFEINNFENFKLIFENEYNNEYYDANSMIRFKIKLNIKEFIILQNVLFPRLVQIEIPIN